MQLRWQRAGRCAKTRWHQIPTSAGKCLSAAIPSAAWHAASVSTEHDDMCTVLVLLVFAAIAAPDILTRRAALLRLLDSFPKDPSADA